MTVDVKFSDDRKNKHVRSESGDIFGNYPKF